MRIDLTSIGLILTLITPGKYFAANPIVRITPGRSVYFDQGGSVSLICEIDQDVEVRSVYLKKDELNWIVIRNVSPCVLYKAILEDPYTYNMTCEQRKFTVVINGINAIDHNKTWSCQMLSANNGPCSSGTMPCFSKGLTIFLRVSVTTVQLRDHSEQPMSTPVTVVEGTSRNFTCSTYPKGSRPRATFRWYNRQEKNVPSLIENQSVFLTPDPVSVPGQPETDLLISYSTLILTGTKSYQNIYIFCSAEDETNDEVDIQSELVQLNIVYPPLLQIFPNSSVDNVTEDAQNFVFKCNVMDANPRPQPNGFRWLYNGKDIQNQTSSTYMIQKVQRSDSGQYQCAAMNSYGIGTSDSLTLGVQYGAEIIKLSVVEGITVNEKSTATLSCLVDSNPGSNITWTKDGSDGSLKTDVSVGQSQLILHKVQCLDATNYTCRATNGLGNPVESKLMLRVNCHPRTDLRTLLITTVYSTRYGNATFRYAVISYPEPSFKWNFIGNGSEKRDLPDSAIQHDNSQQSELKIMNLDIDDFGLYSVSAENSFPPSASVIFELIPGDIPEVPTNVTIVEVTQNSLTAQWVAGFSGGPEQTFYIEASALGLTRSLYAPDPGYRKVGAAMIEGLMENTEYNVSISANNTIGTSYMAKAIKVVTLKGKNELTSLDAPIGPVVGGVISAVVVLVSVAVILFLLNRRTCSLSTFQNHRKKSREKSTLGTGMGQLRINTIQEGEASRREYEGLQDNRTEANPYLQANDIPVDTTENVKNRPCIGNTYEQLHLYLNEQDQTYNSLTSEHPTEGPNEYYENMG